MRSQLALVPGDVLAADGFQLWMTDLERAASLMSLDVPAPERTDGDVEVWADALAAGTDAVPGLAVIVPHIPIGADPIWGHTAEIRTSTGTDLGAVDQVVSVAMPPPEWIAVTTGDLTLDASLPVVTPGVRSWGEGLDFEVHPETTLAPAWTMGWPIRLANRGRSIAWSPMTSLLESWRDGASLAEEPNLAAVAEQLDAYDTVSAVIASGGFGPSPNGRISEAERDAYLASIPDVASFHTVGIGIAATDAGPRSIVVYLFDSEADATAAIEPLGAAWRSDDRYGHPLSGRCRFIDARAAGRTVVVELAPADGATTLEVVTFLQVQRDLVFTHP